MMLRLALLRRIAALVGIAVVAAAGTVGCFGNGASDSTVDTATPTPFPLAADAEVKEILFEDEAIKAMVAGREERQDYWIDISHVGPQHGDRIAWITVVFAEPVFYAGEIRFGSDPCQGHVGEDESLDPDDPCLDEPREYGTRYVTFSGVRDFYATVELGHRQVINMFSVGSSPDTVDDMIEYFKSRQETPTPTATPELTPTVGPPAAERTPGAATPTLEPGVCPVPVRTTPADFVEPPPVRPALELPGQRVQGGVSYSEAYVTVHLPPGREFIILSGWSQDQSGLVISIYDVQADSELMIRGDGCELSRFVRQLAADAVFDEMMASLEVGTTYICPESHRTTPADWGPAAATPLPLSEITGEWVEGGRIVQYGSLSFHLPEGRQFVIGSGLADPGGTFWRIYDVQTGSALFIRPDGCEESRFVREPAADAVFDQIVARIEVVP